MRETHFVFIRWDMRTHGSQNRATPARRRALLEAATRSFAERGLAQTTMDDVAKSAGSSRGAVYHHFSSREELFAAAFADAMESIYAALDEALEGLGTRFGVADGVKRLVRAYLIWHEREPARGLVVRKGLLDERLEMHLGQSLEAQRSFVLGVLARFEPFRREGAIVRASDEVLVALIVGPSRDFIGSWYKLRAVDERKATAAMRDARRALPIAAWAAVRAADLEARPDPAEDVQSAAAMPARSMSTTSGRSRATSLRSSGSTVKS